MVKCCLHSLTNSLHSQNNGAKVQLEERDLSGPRGTQSVTGVSLNKGLN